MSNSAPYAPLEQPTQQPAYNPQAQQQYQQGAVPVAAYPQQAYAPQGQAYPQQQYPQQQGQGYVAQSYVAQPVAYVAQQQGYNPNMGRAGHLPRGAWSDGLFDCFDSLSICCLSCFLVPLRWATTVERLQWMTYMKALVIYGIPWLLLYVFNVVFNLTNLWYLAIPAAICNVLQIAVGMSYRTKMREQYGIQGSQCEDCLLHTFCRCCAVAQEARHVDRDYAFPI